jgi:hypothetical protein
MQETRKCIRCNSIKPIEHFYRHKLCKVCNNDIKVYNYITNVCVANRLNISIEELHEIMTICDEESI